MSLMDKILEIQALDLHPPPEGTSYTFIFHSEIPDRVRQKVLKVLVEVAEVYEPILD